MLRAFSSGTQIFLEKTAAAVPTLFQPSSLRSLRSGRYKHKASHGLQLCLAKSNLFPCLCALLGKFTCIIIFFIFIYLFFRLLAVLGLCCCTQAFSRCGGWGLLSSCGVRASHFSGFSCGAQALGSMGFSCCCSQALENRLSSCGTQI